MTIVYISRHSIPFKEHRGIEKIKESNLIWNKMAPLSILGEKEAEKLSQYKELQNIEVVWSSEYVRAMSTAKYIAYKNNIKVNVDERLGERKHGKIPNDINFNEYNYKQIIDKKYKLLNGENQQDVQRRMLECLYEIINQNQNKNIFICSHSKAITFLLLNWCNLDIKLKTLSFNNQVIFDMKWNAPELFKLTFNDNNVLIDIENIRNY